jgi:hypothetical protein
VSLALLATLIVFARIHRQPYLRSYPQGLNTSGVPEGGSPLGQLSPEDQATINENTYVGGDDSVVPLYKTGIQGRLPLPTLGIFRIVGGDAHIAPRGVFTAMTLESCHCTLWGLLMFAKAHY